MSTLHEQSKIVPMNLRLYKLAKKCIGKIINTYSPNIDVNPIPIYKYSDYSITDEPIRKRRRPVIQMINKYIAKNKKCLLYQLNNESKWPEPSPIFV